MVRIAEYLADSLSQEERTALWDFIHNGHTVKEIETLIELRLAESSAAKDGYEPTQLGRDVVQQILQTKE